MTNPLGSEFELSDEDFAALRLLDKWTNAQAEINKTFNIKETDK